MLFNINEHVRVKLTDHGKAILKKKKLFRVYLEDEDGWSKFQLWELMNIFCEELYNGGRVPFDTTIDIMDSKTN